MARSKSKLVKLNAPSPKRKGTSKEHDRLFPKFLVWVLTAIVLAGLVAKILHVIKHH